MNKATQQDTDMKIFIDIERADGSIFTVVVKSEKVLAEIKAKYAGTSNKIISIYQD